MTEPTNPAVTDTGEKGTRSTIPCARASARPSRTCSKRPGTIRATATPRSHAKKAPSAAGRRINPHAAARGHPIAGGIVGRLQTLHQCLIRFGLRGAAKARCSTERMSRSLGILAECAPTVRSAHRRHRLRFLGELAKTLVACGRVRPIPQPYHLLLQFSPSFAFSVLDLGVRARPIQRSAMKNSTIKPTGTHLYQPCTPSTRHNPSATAENRNPA
jgi:hypothetical protein